jgi:hypothetical protein
VIQRGDTLYGISRRFGVSVDALRNANCLTGDRIFTGRLLWVPGAAPAPEASPPPADTPTPGGQPTQPGQPEVNPTTAVAADPCSNPSARITSPRYGEQVSDLFWLEGTADIPNFLRYEIDVRRDGTDTWMHLGSDRTRVVDGQLAQVQTSRFGSGAFWVRLTVVDQTYNYPPRCAILLNFP